MHHTLDWSHSFTHRLEGSGFSTLLQAGRASTLAARLRAHLQADTLPFLSLSFRKPLEDALPPVLERIAPYKHMVLLGIGGSALGARALQKAFYPQQDWPGHTGKCLWVQDNIDAPALEALMHNLPPKETVVVVVSKSGGTIETMAQYILVRAWLQSTLGDAWKQHVVLVTDATSGELRHEAETHSLMSLPVPDHLGGRYSVLCAVGMLPAAFLGINYQALLRGAAAVSASLLEQPQDLASHPAFRLALWNEALMNAGYSQLLFFCYVPQWQYMGAWFAQLWAESLGKQGKGSLPVPAVGVTDQHSTNQMFLDGPRDKGCLFVSCTSQDKGRAFPTEMSPRWAYLQGKHFGDLLQAESLGTRMALAQSGVPVTHLSLGGTGEEAAGRFMQLAMVTTVFTGWLLDIDPLDQPAVELGKRLANARLGAPGYGEEEKALARFMAEQGQEVDTI